MPPPLDRESLKNLKRSDLQRICKDYGIKANLKTEALIDLLVDTTQARPRPIPPAQPTRAPSGRTVSRAVASGSRPRGTSSSSVIIHDTDEEDNALEGGKRQSAPPPSSEPEATPAPAPAPPPRTRRAKDTQYKLGVGRPTAVGGSGARAVTRSTSLSTKGKRVRGSRSVKPVEAAIQEEEEPDSTELETPQAGPSGITHDNVTIPSPVVHAEVPRVPSPIPTPDNSERLKAYVTDLMAPLQAQIGLMQLELKQRPVEVANAHSFASQITSLRAEMEALRSQAALATQLQTEVQQLRLVVSTLMQQISPGGSSMQSMTSIGKAHESVVAGSTESATGDLAQGIAASSHQQNAFPGVAQLLGKRHREMNDSQCSDMGDAEEQNSNDLDSRATRPIKKKPKLSKEAHDTTPPGTSADVEPTSDAKLAQGGSRPVSRPPPATFTVFSGPEEPPESYIDPPPPTTHLSDLIPAPSGSSAQLQTPLFSGGAIPRPAGSDENAPNRMAFNFSFNTSIFHPITSTPYEMAQPALAYPEPPASPSPGVPSGGFIERAGGRIERNDLYHPHGRRHAQTQAQAQGQDRSQPQSRPQSAASRPPSRAATSQLPTTPSQLDGTGGVPSMNGTVDPTELMGTPGGLSAIPEASQEGSSTGSAGLSNGTSLAPQTRRVASSSEIGLALGMSSTLALPPETPAPPMKRTMYGTELESDTRFGDFGVEGVATGFWAGLVPRF
ncbi:hypothetical protein ACG7TL_000747 [Trametes sanguinea]